MWSHGLHILISITLLCLNIACARPPSNKDARFHSFVTRPDIQPARWNVLIRDRKKLAPGYWFVSPYEKNGYKLPGGSWIGPHIYDNDGELIWSGSHLFNRINVMDFKVIQVNDTELLSMLFAVEGMAYLLDHSYSVKEMIFVGETGVTFNMHDFHTVEDGSKYLYLQRNVTMASREMTKAELGYDDECAVTFPGFQERDVKTGEVLFTWHADGILPFSESTMNDGDVEDRCYYGWDYLHSNAIDKFNDGHYLLSTRHSDTLYKISKDDGSVLWRLHGTLPERSDFETTTLNFSRQHHAVLHENDDKHAVITILDNSLGADDQPAANPWSRAIKFRLRFDTNPMTAELLSSVDHPKYKHAFRRGSHQLLPNGNTFVGWSEHALQSEHSPDGEVIMEAELLATELGTYRAFKFPFVASPDYPPDVYSAAFSSDDNKTTTTTVHVSWNGATEVSTWTLYKTDKTGLRKKKLVNVDRTGFETAIKYAGFAPYVQVQAFDDDGNPLGHGISEPFETVADGVSHSAMETESSWLYDEEITPAPSDWSMDTLAQNPFVSSMAGAITACIVFYLVTVGMRLGWFRRCCGRRRRKDMIKGVKYLPVAADDAAEYDEAGLDDLVPKRYAGLEEPERFKIGDDDDEEEEEFKTASAGRGPGG